MNYQKLIPNLFRTEFSKIVSVLCKTFGISNIQLAEDIASDTFLAATETWSLKGIPDNPKAWLYAVAKNKTKDYFKRNSILQQKIIPDLINQNHPTSELEIDLSEHNIEDSQLKMLFAVCNPQLSNEAQIPLALRVLCGFGIEEIASALLTSKSTINKRLVRAKASFKKNKIQISLPISAELVKRQTNVLTVIYLLFNEGYYSASNEKQIRKNLCLEAMRLLYFFLESYNNPPGNALMAQFCFHASRFDAREDSLGNPILYENQDTKLWSKELIEKGAYYLNLSASGNQVTKYHLEATIAYCHTQTDDTEEKWNQILQTYNLLLQIEYSPIVALNRTYALAKANGKEKAIKEALKIDLKDNHLYHSLLAELYQDLDGEKQLAHLQKALMLTKTEHEQKLLRSKIAAIKN